MVELIEFKGVYSEGSADTFLKGGELNISGEYFPDIAIFNGQIIDQLYLHENEVVIVFETEEEKYIEYMNIWIPLRFYDYYTTITRAKRKEKVRIQL